MRSIFRPRHFNPPRGGRVGSPGPWQAYPPETAATLRAAARVSRTLALSSFGEVGPGPIFPRVAFRAPAGAAEPLRIGLFGGADPEPPAAAERLILFPERLAGEHAPLRSAVDFRIYPVTNPLALTDPARALSGGALRKALWQGSDRADIYYLERELGLGAFHGVVSVDADPSEPATVSASGDVLAREVVAPVLRRLGGQEVAPVGWKPSFSLLAGAELSGRTRPFELRINYPVAADPGGNNFSLLLAELLREYRGFLAFQENI